MHHLCKSDIADCGAGEDAYKLVMTYAILCGVLWIGAGALSFVASISMNKMFVFISSGIFIFGYLIFIGIFGAVMVQVNSRNNELRNSHSDIKKKLRRSGDEFMGYSICSFILIFGAIACTGFAGISL